MAGKKFNDGVSVGKYGCVVAIAAMAVFFALSFGSITASIETGNIGVVTQFGEVTGRTLVPGLHFILPWQSVREFNCKILKYDCKTECFSKDLQLIDVALTIMTSLPENKVIEIYSTIGKDYMNQVTPRVLEILKQCIAKYNAEEVIDRRAQIRDEFLAICVQRLASIVDVNDVALTNVSFSDVYERAIEQKQVAQQEALKAKYELDRAKTEADKAIAVAKGEAEAIRIKGETLEKNPSVIQLEAIHKWDGHAPQTVVLGANENVPVVFPIK